MSSVITERVTLTMAALRAIQLVAQEAPIDAHVSEIHVAPVNGSTHLVTLDAGYGTHSFYVNRNGRTWEAGLGETVPRKEERRWRR